MTDQSTKHGPRMDDALKEDTGTRAEEWKRWDGPEDAEDGQRTNRNDVESASAGALDEREVETRSDLARYVLPSAFPGGKEEMLSAALGEHAPDWVIDVLQRLPADERFANFEALWERLGGRGERRA